MTDLENVEKLCEALQNEDPNFLKFLGDMSPETLEIIEKVSKENFGCENKGVIAIMIHKFLTGKRFTMPKNILGPVSLVQMEHPNYPHIFYMFGDIHHKLGKCKNSTAINHFIRNIINNLPVFIDVYLESPYKYKDYRAVDLPSGSYIYDTTKEFKKKLYEAEFKKCPTSRYHYTDIRSLFETHKFDKGLVNLYVFDQWPVLNKEDYKEIFNFFAFFSDEDSIPVKRIIKQFSNIQIYEIREKLSKGFNDCLKRAKLSTEKMKLDLEPYENLDIPLYTSSIEKGLLSILEYMNAVIEYYMLARVFRSYKKGTGKYNWASYNNILYTGRDHTFNMQDILEGLGFSVVIMSAAMVGERYQCLDVSDVDPMFHQRYYQRY